MVEESFEGQPPSAHPTTQSDGAVQTISGRVLKWAPIAISLAGGFLIGSLFALAALVSFANKEWSYFVAFVITGVICTFLPLGLVKLIMWWADEPLRSSAESDRVQQDPDD